MGHSEWLQTPATGPALSGQLLPGIDRETATPFSLGEPDIATGPHRVHPPVRLVWDGAKQQCAAFIREGRAEGVMQNREALMIQAQQRWHKQRRVDTLC